VIATASATGPGRHRGRGFLADENAATAVEFALVAAPFLALIVGIIQTFLVIFASQLLETVVAQSSRQILTGQAQSAGTTQIGFAAQVCDQVRILFNCNNLMIDVETYSSWSATNPAPSAFPQTNSTMPALTYNAQGQVTNTWQYIPGSTGSVVVVRVMYQWPVLGGSLLGFNLANLPNGTRLLMAAAAFQNEPP
jgi:Flp pilus assembly protein TadG